MPGELLEGPLDLPKLNAVAANFDTIIRAAAEFKQSLGVNPGSISRPHQPGSLAIKVIGEPVGGEFRLTPIAIGQVTALDHDFTNFAGCDRFAIISDKSDPRYHSKCARLEVPCPKCSRAASTGTRR